MISRRTLALAGFGGTVVTALLALVGQVDPDPQLDHLALTVSDFAVQDRGGATDIAMVVFGASAVAVAGAVRERLAQVLLALFAVAMVVAAVAPTDFEGPLSTVGYIHRYASMVAFVVLPVVALVLNRTRWMVGVSVGFMLLMLASATIGDRVLIGLAERFLLLAEVVLLAMMAWDARGGGEKETGVDSADDSRREELFISG